ncbi:glycoside hydrolase family 95 protein [Lentithecium fluviatile CBS 122367]|uniref:Glycoside hydrolase family 95 protein n=1 Tax=Lentithecium fluviatile CBS 122367 TaxID=1168545 RepID=A0A6G1IFU4_9PLEO|nr:glycoside hydrolase family 95 protein [Lentithecium fluviatile CBS 122367]
MKFATLPTLLFLLPQTLALAPLSPSTYLHYPHPANSSQSALPIGNGRLGALIYGALPAETLSLNENSVWSGPWLDRTNRASSSALPSVRELLKQGNLTAAGQLVLRSMAGKPNSPRMYGVLVNMTLDFGGGGIGEGYTRWLDTERGLVFVEYAVGGVKYTREYLASHPAGVLATRLSASQPGKLSVKISLARSKWVLSHTATVKNGSSSVTLVANSGQESDAIEFTSEVRILNTGGTVSKDGTAIQITNATTIDIFFNAETSYRHSTQSTRLAELTRKLDAASAAGYPAVKKAAITDFTTLTQRVHLNLGTSSNSTSSLPTNDRLTAYKTNPNADPELATLYFNYGRYLLASSSRSTRSGLSLPANLQGLWNERYDPPWGSKYTININIEMNYWPALVTNLAETHTPLFDLLDRARARGTEVAKLMYGCDNGGFVLHHNLDLWGDAAPVDNGTAYTMWPMGGAWLSAHLMEHYRFTRDEAFLKERVWPVLRQAADFYYCYLFEWEGYYNTGPSISPENPFRVPADMSRAGATEAIDISPTMDNVLLHELFGNVIETCQVLGITDSHLTQAQAYLSKIRKPRIGSKGQLLEWRREYEAAEPGHRHMSPIYGLYPGSQMTPLVNSTLAAAAKVLLEQRMSAGSGSTGWSRTWVMNLYARLFQGDKVWSNAVSFLQTFPTANLWNTDHGPGSAFQIDGNFGFTAAIAEMLLQSHSVEGAGTSGGINALQSHNVVHLLPALPSAVPTGSVEGLVARGNFVIDMQWADRKLSKAVVTSRSGGKLALRVQDAASFAVKGVKYTAPIDTTAGASYTITPA